MDIQGSVTGLVDLVSNVGFPIFISFYLLHHFDGKMDQMIEKLEELCQLSRQEKSGQ